MGVVVVVDSSDGNSSSRQLGCCRKLTELESQLESSQPLLDTQQHSVKPRHHITSAPHDRPKHTHTHTHT